ncbi:GNAT family N-acetyltransferase [Chitinophaga flava]|uniref:GNAT family N-acetyltransferase n=1 Tax=Chitinophaga flava TaxID=2259036 RepID=A0A365XWM4_9BACT|nr:GNAT family protein [Chitinophaga flava]RBL90401.1 GNAT family N-acetyltransferase [Chitinophaga flava]
MNEIKLRKLTATDNTELARMANNKLIWNNLRDRFPHPYSLEDADFFINLVKDEEPCYNFAIEYNGKLAGVITLMPQEDVYRRNAEIGYWIGQEFWGKQIMTQAIALITDYGFKSLQLKRIFTGIFEYNPASMRALEKNGYEKEGIAQQSIYKNGQYWNEHKYAKLNPDL